MRAHVPVPPARRLRRRRLALALFTLLAASAAQAQNLPGGGSVASGSATIGYTGTQATINQSSQGVIINWLNFDIGNGYSVQFNQPNASAVALNRVVGTGGPSVIDGTLTANGRVFLLNTAGILFGGNAQVNVGGLVASTLAMSDADFLAGVSTGRFQFTGYTGNAGLRNNGSIQAGSGGVALVGPSVINDGSITANGATIAVGAGTSVALDYFGDGLTQVLVTAPADIDSAFAQTRRGSMTADAGRILLRTAATAGGSGGNLYVSGTLRARTLANVNGRVELTSEGGMVMLGAPGVLSDANSPFTAGYIDVTGDGGQTGGYALLRGNSVVLINEDDTPFAPANPFPVASRIDASGGGGGGVVDLLADTAVLLTANSQVLAEASLQGSGGNVRIAGQAVGMDRNSEVRAGSKDGDGGSVLAVASSALALYGALNASGTLLGGSILTATAGNFDLRGLQVNANGLTPGSWTLWAPNLSVVHGNDLGSLASPAAGLSLQDNEINGALANATNVILRAGTGPADAGNVDFAAGVDIQNRVADLFLRVDADGAISGRDFRIGASLNGRLAMYFNADASNRSGGYAGIRFTNADLDSNGGDIWLYGQSDPLAGFASNFSSGIRLLGGSVRTGGGSLLLRGATTAEDASDGDAGVRVDGTVLDTAGGDLTLVGQGADFTHGVALVGASLTTGGGRVRIDGSSSGSGIGVRSGGTSFASSGGAIEITGSGDTGVWLDAAPGFSSGGGAIRVVGSGAGLGVSLRDGTLASGGGAIEVRGSASGNDGVGAELVDARLQGGAGDVVVVGEAANGRGLRFVGAAAVATTTGGIALTGIGRDVGLALDGGEVTTVSGRLDLRGRGTGAGSSGLVIGDGVNLTTNGGGIALAGEGVGGAGVRVGNGALVDAGNSLLVLRAGNAGGSDAVVLDGSLRSSFGINLRPGGVEAGGGLSERTGDAILLGAGSGGFVLDAGELGRVITPRLVIGSQQHAGAIRVLGAIGRDGDLTLQNQGGSGGIDLQAGLDVGSGTLTLASGGDITQTAAGALRAHSLLAIAAGNVALDVAQNDVAATTLGGRAGGSFRYQDRDALAIGTVTGAGFDAAGNAFGTLSASGVQAGGNVFVRNLQGDLTLRADVAGADIDLVTANTLQNPVGARLLAGGHWRVWAQTWVGETRGGLAGSGALPNLYGCQYQGSCGVSIPAGDDHFIYVQQPVATIRFDDASREYGLPNPAFTFSVTGAILGDSAAAVASGSAGTTATTGSDVGSYPISGTFFSPAGYQLVLLPGTLSITPATLLFTADPAVRYLGVANPPFTGTVTGFRNGDTVASVFGSAPIWTSPAGLLSPIGFYPILGTGTPRNYVITQAPGNATALQIIPLPQLSATPTGFVSEPVNTYVYDRNIAGAPVCALNASIDDPGLASAGDDLANEWSRVRTRPNLSSCFQSERRNGCSDF